MSKLWGGCFSAPTASVLAELNCSLTYDSRLYAYDIDGSKAYASALLRAGILDRRENEVICNGLELVRLEWIEGRLKVLVTDEDVHTVNERRLTEIVGSAGEKLHTGRSRNDQVVTDMRLWMRNAIEETLSCLRTVLAAGLQLAEQNFEVIMPGYTHLQRAQAVLFPHWVLSHMFALREDCTRFADLRSRADVLPLGSGAIAGNPLGVDREFLARELGFKRVTENSMHAVGDRDFLVEYIFAASLTSVHLSRLAEDLILYATKEFNFIRIADEFSTGSSLMPQKRNPDSLELVRGMSGGIFGNLTGIVMTLKGTPSTYNKDFQYDKKFVFDSFDQLKQILDVTAGVLSTLKINPMAMESSLSADMLATDWAYYLVRKGVPFRQAHHIIGKVVAYGETKGLSLTEIPLVDLKQISDQFDDDIMHSSNFRSNLEQYKSTGGTSSDSVRAQIGSLLNFLDAL